MGRTQAQTGFLSSVQVLFTLSPGAIYIHGGGKSKDPKGKSGKREGSFTLALHFTIPHTNSSIHELGNAQFSFVFSLDVA